jgi:hypothetical protein
MAKIKCKLLEKTSNLQFSLSPRWKAWEASATAAMNRSTSRSPAPRELRRGHGPRPGGSLGSHVAEAERPSPKRHDSSGVVLPDHFRQGDPGISQASQHGPVRLEHLLLLCLGGAVRPVPLRLRNGAASVRRKCVLGVVPQVEPSFVPATVRAGQRRRDVVVAAALLHPKVGTVDAKSAPSAKHTASRTSWLHT